MLQYVFQLCAALSAGGEIQPVWESFIQQPVAGTENVGTCMYLNHNFAISVGIHAMCMH